MQQYALGENNTAQVEGSVRDSGAKAALPLHQVRSHPTRAGVPRFQMVETLTAEAQNTAPETEHAGFALSGVRRWCPEIPQARTRTIAFLRQSVSLFRMQSALSRFQVGIASAARKPVVIAPSMTGPSK